MNKLLAYVIIEVNEPEGLRRIVMINFKKSLYISIIIIIFLLYPVELGNVSDKLIRVGTYPNEPVIFRNENGEIDGFFSDIIEHIAEEEGWEIEYVHGSWEEGLQRLNSGEIDLMLGIAYTEERDRFYEYPEEGVITTWGQIYTRPGTDILSILDLEGKSVGVLRNDIYYIGDIGLRELARKFQVQCNFIEFDNYDQIMNGIETGKIGAGMVPRLYGISKSDIYEVEDSPVVINPIDLTVATPEGENSELLAVVDEYLTDMKSDDSSYYHERLEYWTTRYEEEEMPFYLKVLLLLVYIVFSLFIFVLFLVRRQVRVKTRQLREKEQQLQQDIKRRKKLEKNLQDNKVKITKLHQVAIKMEQLELPAEIYEQTVEAAESILDFKLCLLKVMQDRRLQTVAVSSSFFELKYGQDLSLPDNNKDLIDDCFSSVLIFPLENIGELQVYPGPDNAFGEEEQELTHLLLSHTISALQRLQAEEKIRYISFHDRLTGLYNRDYLEEEMQRLDSQRQLPLSIIMGDVDGLKVVNDTFGHEKGDQLLREVASILKQSTRNEDIIGRWGGDEFLIILPRTEEEGAQKIIDRILQSCRETDWILPFNISLGTGVKKEKEQEIDEIIKQADDEMYTNKVQQGSNSREAMLKAMLSRLKDKEYVEDSHNKKVKELALKLGDKLDLNQKKKKRLGLAAIYHDIGMLSVPDSVLLKEGKLQSEEWEKIKSHPETGYRVVRMIDEYNELSECILHHHENWDGSGYPAGLAGKDIPLGSRIIRIVDSYQALVNDRIYRDKLDPEKAGRELKSEAGKSLDPQLVQVFLNEVLPEKIG